MGDFLDTTISVLGIDGRSFTVRLIRAGERWGRQRAVLHQRPDPLVCFHDSSIRFADDADEARYGQFTGGGYNASTLLAHDPDARLCLHGGSSAIWTVKAGEMRKVQALLRDPPPLRRRRRSTRPSPLAG